MSDDIAEAPYVRDDEEGLFSRDIVGQLVRLDRPSDAHYTQSVTVRIDGRSVQVWRAEPLEDAQGNILVDVHGRTTPRYTTIFDAIAKLHAEARGPLPVPTLCHQPHMSPVAVCRVCVVQLYRTDPRGARKKERKLMPACQHRVEAGMEVFTMHADGDDGRRVQRAVRVMTELLTPRDAEAPAPAPAGGPDHRFDQLAQVARLCGVERSRFALDVFADPSSRPDHPAIDDSSPVFRVDHDACILCDRCSRACHDATHEVIGRTGKGGTVRVGFDLDVPMAESSCVQCGECMVACPTGAIVFKPVVRVRPRAGTRGEHIDVDELLNDPLLSAVPPKFLLWQEGLVLRRRVSAGEILCRKGEPGNTAFIIKRGRLRIVAEPGSGSAGIESGPEDLIVGEMACLSGSPRTADVVATEDGEIWEIRRNVLDRLMRSPAHRARFQALYRDRALDMILRRSDLFADVPPDEYRRCLDLLKPGLSFLNVAPGQVIFAEGDPADHLYVVRLGNVRVSVIRSGQEVTALSLGPGTLLGEIGLLALSHDNAAQSVDDVDRWLRNLISRGPRDALPALPPGRRTATCSALDHVELVRIGRTDFLRMITMCPSVRRHLVSLSLDRLRENARSIADPLVDTSLEYLKQGLYQGQSLLVLDLNRCTRCDLCTEACIAQHGTSSHGVEITRMLREGLRFGDYLVATACRSCKDAYCMVGCPVDSIHRGRHLQIVIEDHCIGCGLCAQNCPFGTIFMVDVSREHEAEQPVSGGRRVATHPKAATCDLCDADGRQARPTPRCVYVCPHDAAARVTGEELLETVRAQALAKDPWR